MQGRLHVRLKKLCLSMTSGIYMSRSQSYPWLSRLYLKKDMTASFDLDGEPNTPLKPQQHTTQATVEVILKAYPLIAPLPKYVCSALPLYSISIFGEH